MNMFIFGVYLPVALVMLFGLNELRTEETDMINAVLAILIWPLSVPCIVLKGIITGGIYD